MDSEDSIILDVFEDNLDDEDGIFEGRLLDLFAMKNGYPSFGAFAARMFRQGKWIYCRASLATSGYVANGNYYRDFAEANAMSDDLDEPEPRQASRITCETGLYEEKRPIREMTKYVRRLGSKSQALAAPSRRRQNHKT
jgi:hypothetical protein